MFCKLDNYLKILYRLSGYVAAFFLILVAVFILTGIASRISGFRTENPGVTRENQGQQEGNLDLSGEEQLRNHRTPKKTKETPGRTQEIRNKYEKLVKTQKK